MKLRLLLILIVLSTKLFSQNCQQDSTISFLFMGDIMGHQSQINSAFNPQTNTYDYYNVFKEVSPIFKSVDFAIANLEVTLAGRPYKGYPQFSSPDELAIACKNSGINVLTTANNHSCDRGTKGILRTIKVLDSLGIRHTGTFSCQDERERNNLLIINKNGIKVGILNYTYGTNGIEVKEPAIVNKISHSLIASDIQKSKRENLDKLIVVIHWGLEYKTSPNENQINLAKFMFKKGVDIIIGSHPHVLQRMEYHQEKENAKERLIVYSLGNFVSNQRTSPRDGGAMIRFTLKKQNNKVSIKDYGYHLTWVNKAIINGKAKFQIIPCLKYEANNYKGLTQHAKNKMKIYTSKARALLNNDNKLVKEYQKETTTELSKINVSNSATSINTK